MRKFFIQHGWLVILSVFIIYSLFIILASYPVTNVWNQSINTIGSLGDSFGVLTAFFSALAVWIASSVLVIQEREFKNLKKLQKYGVDVQRAALQPNFILKYKESGRVDIESVVYRQSTVSLSSTNGNPFFNTHAKSNINLNKDESKQLYHPIVSTRKEGDILNIQIRGSDQLNSGSRIFVYYTDITGNTARVTLGFGIEEVNFLEELSASDAREGVETLMVDEEAESLQILNLELLDAKGNQFEK